jgi:hypothetical protein
VRALKIAGALTAGYGVLSIAKPGLLAKQLKQTDVLGNPQAGAVVASQTVGVRDLVSGLSLVLLPAGKARTAAIVARVAFDVSDAVLWPQALPDPAVQKKIRAVGLAWGGLCAAAFLHTTLADASHKRNSA